MASEKRDVLAILSFGFFLILLGAVVMITPNYYSEAVSFFRDFRLREAAQNIYLPAPRSNHPVIYTAIAQFCIVYSLFQMVILVWRFILGESLSRKAGTLGGIVFWLGAGSAALMLAAGKIGWFGFLAELIIFVGLAIVARSVTVLIAALLRTEL